MNVKKKKLLIIIVQYTLVGLLLLAAILGIITNKVGLFAIPFIFVFFVDLICKEEEIDSIKKTFDNQIYHRDIRQVVRE